MSWQRWASGPAAVSVPTIAADRSTEPKHSRRPPVHRLARNEPRYHRQLPGLQCGRVHVHVRGSVHGLLALALRRSGDMR